LYTVWAIVRNTIEGSKTMGEGERQEAGSRKREAGSREAGSREAGKQEAGSRYRHTIQGHSRTSEDLQKTHTTVIPAKAGIQVWSG
jgi:hypothetical protein